MIQITLDIYVDILSGPGHFVFDPEKSEILDG